MHPLVLTANQPADRFYRGGPRITAFRAGQQLNTRLAVTKVPTAQYVPEDWVGSTTSVRGEDAGRTVLPDGTGLLTAIERDLVGWLGPDHLRAFGPDTMLLVKLLDAGQRLPVHAHPDSAFAQLHLGARHGKAEAWYLLTPGPIYLGLRREMTAGELRRMVDEQDIEALLAAMHRVDLQAHDTVYVPPGVLHAIGEGILLAEVQEPEDLSILLDWRDFTLDGTVDGHLGLGFDTALQAVETGARSTADIQSLIIPAAAGQRVPDQVRSCLPAESDRYFRLQRVDVRTEVTVDAGFAVVIGIDGAARLTGAGGSAIDVAAGSTVLVPYAAGPLTLTGAGSVLIARPPLPAGHRS